MHKDSKNGETFDNIDGALDKMLFGYDNPRDARIARALERKANRGVRGKARR